MNEDCILCHRKTIEKLSSKHHLSAIESEKFSAIGNSLLLKHKEKPNPEIATAIQRVARHICGKQDLYLQEKRQANELIAGLYSGWQDIVHRQINPLLCAAKLAVAGNIIDYGAHSVSDDIAMQVYALYSQKLAIDASDELFAALHSASSLLYIGDNTGEIVFDKLFLETLGFPNVYYAVRGAPVLNDATREDAEWAGIDKFATIIDNGHDAPSTILPKCSEEFRSIFNSADVVISKGQGNFEGLCQNTRNNLFFMLVAKCNPISALIGCQKGDMLIAKGPFL